MSPRNLAAQKFFKTFRLLPEDRTLLQDLGRGTDGVENRTEALEQLAEVLETMQIPKVGAQDRRALRLGIPLELDTRIREIVEETGQTYIDVLVMAAKEFRKRNPITPID